MPEPIAFGKYLLVEKIAQGGMAEVYRALLRGPAGFEKTVALKRVLPAFSQIEEFVARFLDEARLVAGLTHMNIAQVFDFGEAGGSYYLAMELVDGVDLGRLVEQARARRDPLPMAAAAFIVAEAARGLAFAHGRSDHGRPLGIVHRDVSPQNILVSYAGEVKIADFGIAKATQALHRAAAQTGSGAVMGKLRYMSPEQVAGEPLDGRSDLFALGVVLWEALTGRPLIDADHPAGAVEQVKSARFDPPSKWADGIPAELDRIVARALMRDREARYGKAAELARDLSLLLSERAPSFAREDLGAFVERVAPRRREGGDSDDRPDVGDEARAPALADTIASLRPSAPPTGSGAARAAELTRLSPRAEAETRLATAPPRGWKRRTAAVAAVTLLVGAVAGAAAIKLRVRGPSLALPVDGGAVALIAPRSDGSAVEPPDAALAPSDRRRARLLDELARTPREEVTRRGVASSPEYRALLTAVDGALCATPAGSDEPLFPADAEEALRQQALLPEATALARYLLVEDALTPPAQAALDGMLRRAPAWAPGSPAAGGYAAAALATLAHPDDPRFALDLVRQQGALGRWRETPGPHPAQCERRAAVEHLARVAPEAPLTRALRRYLAAAAVGVAVEERGLRFAVIGAERDREGQSLSVVLKVTNPGAQPAATDLASARLGDAVAPPALEPDLSQLAGNNWREVRLTFSTVDDAAADAAVLVLRPGIELQAYSEVLR